MGTPGCLTTDFLGMRCKPWLSTGPKTLARGKERGSQDSRGAMGKGGILDGKMGNHTLQSTQAFMGPGETPVHGAHGTALSDSVREGQAGNDPAPGSQLSPPPLRCVPAHGCQSGFVCTRVPAGRGREAGSPNSPPCCGLGDPLPSPGHPGRSPPPSRGRR